MEFPGFFCVACSRRCCVFRFKRGDLRHHPLLIVLECILLLRRFRYAHLELGEPFRHFLTFVLECIRLIYLRLYLRPCLPCLLLLFLDIFFHELLFQRSCLRLCALTCSPLDLYLGFRVGQLRLHLSELCAHCQRRHIRLWLRLPYRLPFRIPFRIPVRIRFRHQPRLLRSHMLIIIGSSSTNIFFNLLYFFIISLL